MSKEFPTQGNAKMSDDNQLEVVSPAVNATEVDLSTDTDIHVSDVPSVLLGIYVKVVLSAHDANINDADTTVITLPSEMAAGINLNCYGTLFENSIIVESNDSATGKIIVFWREA